MSETDVSDLGGINDPVSVTDVIEVYLPLSRVLNLHVLAARNRRSLVEIGFFGRPAKPSPFVIAIAGSVGVGKSTFGRMLQAILRCWPEHPKVDLVTTDGFLLPTRELQKRELMRRKGFPESYDLKRMLAFLASIKSGDGQVSAPIYSHETYDIIPDKFQVVDRPEIVIFEGLNVLQTAQQVNVVASDFFDFSIYIDADENMIEAWYIQRFLTLQRTVFQRPSSYFHHYRDLDERQATQLARKTWQEVNLPNLLENILPTRDRATLVVRKAESHRIDGLKMVQF